MDVEYDYMPERNFKAGFDDVVPTLNLSYMLGTSATLRANYNMRINRPGIWYLNPFRDTSNPTSVSYGNPDLDTEKAHILGMTSIPQCQVQPECQPYLHLHQQRYRTLFVHARRGCRKTLTATWARASAHAWPYG